MWLNVKQALSNVFLWSTIKPRDNYKTSKFNKYRITPVRELDISTKIESICENESEWASLLTWFDRHGCSFELDAYHNKAETKQRLTNWFVIAQAATDTTVQEHLRVRCKTKRSIVRSEEGYSHHWHYYKSLPNQAAKRKYCINLSEQHLEANEELNLSNLNYEVELYLNPNDPNELTDRIFFIHKHTSHTFSAYLLESIHYTKSHNRGSPKAGKTHYEYAETRGLAKPTYPAESPISGFEIFNHELLEVSAFVAWDPKVIGIQEGTSILTNASLEVSCNVKPESAQSSANDSTSIELPDIIYRSLTYDIDSAVLEQLLLENYHWH
jgi:hypothetical protein